MAEAKNEQEMQRRARIIWQVDGLPYADAHEALGCMPGTVSDMAWRLGFARGAGLTQFTAGPCTDCLVPTPATALDAHRRCEVCAAMANGDQPKHLALITELYGVDLAAERAEHRRRMRERAMGIRSPLPEDVRTRTSAGTVKGAYAHHL